jgi:hypothetical protein
MARGGFYPVESGSLSFRRDGRWYSDDEPILNPRIALLFSRSLQRAADGRYFLKLGDERAEVRVEDAPYVVQTVEGEPHQRLWLLLNDGTREPLDGATLAVGADHALYCRVKGGRFEARFLRSAYYHLIPFIDEDGRGGFCLRLGGRTYPLRPHPARARRRSGH